MHVLDEEIPLMQNLWCTFQYVAEISQCENHQAVVSNFETGLAGSASCFSYPTSWVKFFIALKTLEYSVTELGR